MHAGMRPYSLIVDEFAFTELAFYRDEMRLPFE